MKKMLLTMMIFGASGSLMADECFDRSQAAWKAARDACAKPGQPVISKKCRAEADKAKADEQAKCKAEKQK